MNLTFSQFIFFFLNFAQVHLSGNTFLGNDQAATENMVCARANHRRSRMRRVASELENEEDLGVALGECGRKGGITWLSKVQKEETQKQLRIRC